VTLVTHARLMRKIQLISAADAGGPISDVPVQQGGTHKSMAAAFRQGLKEGYIDGQNATRRT
jgi:hypothetical protein